MQENWQVTERSRGQVVEVSHSDDPGCAALKLWSDSSDQTWALFARRTRRSRFRQIDAGRWPAPTVAKAEEKRLVWLLGKYMKRPTSY